jgi:formylglycine-generating enzyme required for sulfatase activity
MVPVPARVPPVAPAPPVVTNPAPVAMVVAPAVPPAVTNPPLSSVRPEAGKDWKSPTCGMEFVWVAALQMWVGRYPVTNGEYRKLNPDHYSDVYQGHSLNGNRQPAVNLSFFDARGFADWMTQAERAAGNLASNQCYRVPTETEWMTCAQCGDSRTYPWGNTLPPKYGNYADTSAKAVFPTWNSIAGYTDGSAVACDVEKSGKNDWGLYGMGGNVWVATAKDSAHRLFAAWCGASWRMSKPDFLRCDYRSTRDSVDKESDFGFRLVLAVE